jgi:murein DD-endopeptidase MepM/ murein hydrolase activator NlpD
MFRGVLCLGLLLVALGGPTQAQCEGEFVEVGGMDLPRILHTSTLLPEDGSVLVVGGFSAAYVGDQFVTETAELYDPTTSQFSTTGSMIFGRASHTATYLPAEVTGRGSLVLIAGGALHGTALNSAEVYDPALGAFTRTVGDMTTGRVAHTATLLQNGKVLLVGGRQDTSILASAELYDPELGTFAATGSMSQPRYLHTATMLENGKVLVAGGSTGSSTAATAEIYDPATGRFTPTGNMTEPRLNHTATRLASGEVLIVGGPGSNVSGTLGLKSAELYDPVAGTFSATGSMSTPRNLHVAALLADGRVLVAGGALGRDRGVTATAEVYDRQSGTFSSTETMVDVRAQFTATRLEGGDLLVAGGAYAELSGTYLRTAELFSYARVRYPVGDGVSEPVIVGRFGGNATDVKPSYRGHLAVDYRASVGTPVRTFAAGRVCYVHRSADPEEPGYGHYVVVEHDLEGGLTAFSFYAHLSDLLVVPGADVCAGDPIAESGDSGGVDPHLHFATFAFLSGFEEMRGKLCDGTWVPKGYLNSSEFSETLPYVDSGNVRYFNPPELIQSLR